MHKKIPICDITQEAYAWQPEPQFVPPVRDGGAVACVEHEFVPPRLRELKGLLVTFLSSIINTIPAHAGMVRLISPDGQTLQIISSSGLSAELQEDLESFVELDCEAHENADTNCLIHAVDIRECTSRANCRYVTCRFQSLISVPLESPAQPDVILGYLTLFFDLPREIATRSMCYLDSYAEMMAAAIEHSRSNREASRVERLTARRVIANDIHDSLSQTLTYARMRGSLLQNAIDAGNDEVAAKYARDMDEALEIGQKAARDLIADFRCEFNTGGLLMALSDLTTKFREHNNIALEYRNHLVDLELPLEHEIQIYHIVREALTNISRHSGATQARLLVEQNLGYYSFTIEDNGSGARTFMPVEGHYGMMIMRERAQRIHGDIKITSAAGQGTQVQLSFPEPATDWRGIDE